MKISIKSKTIMTCSFTSLIYHAIFETNSLNRREAEEKRNQLEAEREDLNSRREGVLENLHQVQLSYDSLKVQIFNAQSSYYFTLIASFSRKLSMIMRLIYNYQI